MNMIWTDIWHMDTVSVSTRPHFLVDKAPEPHDGRVVLRLNDFQPKVFTNFTNRLDVFIHDSLLPC